VVSTKVPKTCEVQCLAGIPQIPKVPKTSEVQCLAGISQIPKVPKTSEVQCLAKDVLRLLHTRTHEVEHGRLRHS